MYFNYCLYGNVFSLNPKCTKLHKVPNELHEYVKLYHNGDSPCQKRPIQTTKTVP